MLIEHLETPALIVEKTILEENAKAMTELLKDKKLALRPHYKSHKCAQIAHWQIKSGAVGMTCAKLAEAIDLADSGIEDILIANQIVQPQKVSRLAQLAGQCHLTVCVDDANNIKALAKAAKDCGTIIYCLVEYEIGLKRCGVTTHEEVARLAELVMSYDSLSFEGIQAYAGHLSHMADKELREKETYANSAELRKLILYLKERGIEVKVLSGGSTGTSLIKAEEGLYTELQAGSYLFMDATYTELDLPFKNSLFIVSTVLSSRDGLAVIDAGVKSCGVDQGMPKCIGVECSEIGACEEHFQMFDPSRRLKVGEKVFLIPGHCCSTVNLYDWIYVVDNGKVIDRIRVTASGASK